MKNWMLIFLGFFFLTCKSDTKSIYTQTLPGDSLITIKIINTTNFPFQIGFKNRFNDNELLYFNGVSDSIVMKGLDFLPLRVQYGKKTIAFPLLMGDSIDFTLNNKNIINHQYFKSPRKEFDTSFFDYLNKTLKEEYNRLDRLYF